MRSPQRCDPSCSLSRKPCRVRTMRCGWWLRTAPMEAAAHPAPGTHCPGTWGRHSGAGGAEVALAAMAVSWTLLSGQSSGLQVTRKGIVPQLPRRSWLPQPLLCAGAGVGRGGEVRRLRVREGPRPARVTAGRTAPPAGPTPPAAQACGSFAAVAPSRASGRSPAPQGRGDTFLGSWGRAAFQDPRSWLPPWARWKHLGAGQEGPPGW